MQEAVATAHITHIKLRKLQKQALWIPSEQSNYTQYFGGNTKWNS
jgi:hypothetical protein